jgi:eukaryotic-like serine/threonine-protein kinase
MLAPDTILNDRYRIKGLLGKGGMGAIYEGVDLNLSKPVAIKENLALTDALRYAFTREARLLANLRHDALPQVLHHFTLKDGQFLVMEFISGRNLAELLHARNNIPFSPKEVVLWADTLLDVLCYLHDPEKRFEREKPIVHGDIKPANLKLNSEGRLFLLDFGLAKGKAGLMSSLASSIPIRGYSAHYASIEQILGADMHSYNVLSAIDSPRAQRIARQSTEPRSDLFSLGSTLYHLITGSVPPEATLRAARVWAGQPDPLLLASDINSQVAPSVAEVLARSMALPLEDRFPSAIEMRKAFREAGQSVLATEGGSIKLYPQGALSGLKSVPLVISPTPATILSVKYGTLGSCESSVRSVAFSPSGLFIASGSNDNIVRLWDLRTGEESVLGQCDFRESGFSYVSSVAFSPDSKSVASGSSDQTVRVWSTQVDEMRILGRCDDAICSVAFSPDGGTIASGSSNGSIHLWNVETGQMDLLGECDSAIWSVAFSPDGKTIAAENDNKRITLWDLQSRQMRILNTDKSDVWSVAFSGDGNYVASGSWDQHIRLWDVRTAAMRVLGKCDGVVRAVAFSSDGALLCSGSDDNSVRVWDTQTGEMRVLGSCDDVVATVAFSPDKRSIASGSWDSKIRLWKVT